MSKNLVANVIRRASLPDQISLYARLRQASVDPKRSKDARLAARLAARWLRARTFNALEDLMARLQVLEGVAGVRPWTWANKGPRALPAARDALSGNAVDESWFSPKPTGMLKLLFVGLQRIVGTDADDYLQNGLMGLKIEGDEEGETYSNGPLLYQVGRFNSKVKSGILDGSETPDRIGAGAGGHVFRQKALAGVTNERRRQEILGPTVNNPGTSDGEGVMRDVAEMPGRDRERILIDILTDPRDPLGKQLRNHIRSQWSGATGKVRQALDLWMDAIERGETPNVTEIAKSIGLSQISALSRFIQDKVTSSPEVEKAIELRLIREGKFASRLAARYLRQRRRA